MRKRSKEAGSHLETGERFVPGFGDVQIHLEHLQRYELASQLLRAGSVVVDYGCGVGYGSEVLARRATRVLGVDVDPEVVRECRERFKKGNLDFELIKSAEIPVPDGSVDVVVAFEVIEHTIDQAGVISEIARVLRPEGLLLISTPETQNYSIRAGYRNPFHVAEMTFREFDARLATFPHRFYFRQRFAAASLLLEANTGTHASWSEYIVRYSPGERPDPDARPTKDEAYPIYYVAICSRVPLPPHIAEMQQVLVDDNDAFIGTLTRSIESLKRHIMNLEGGVAERNRKIEELQEELDTQPKSPETQNVQFDDLRRELRERDQEGKQHEASLAESKTEAEQLQAALSKQHGEIEKYKRHITNLEGGTVERDRKIEELQERLDTQPKSLETQEVQLDDLRRKLRERDQEGKQHEASLAESKTEAGQLQAALAKQQAEIEKYKRHITNLEEGTAERDRKIEELQEGLDTQSKSLETQKVQLHDLRRELRERDQEGRRREASLTESEKEAAELRAALAKQHGEIEKYKRHIMILEGGVAERDRELEAQSAQLQRIAMSGSYWLAQKFSSLVPTAVKRVYRAYQSEVTPPVSQRRSVQPEPVVMSGPLSQIKLSVVVPIYNHGRYIRPMLESILAGTRKPDEVILVDDCSSDPEVAVVLREYSGVPGIAVLSNVANMGISETLNRGVMHATGDYVALVDCDDLLTNDALKVVEDFLREKGSVDFVYTNRVDIDEEGVLVREWDFTNRATQPTREGLMLGMFTSHLKVIRTRCLLDVGLFKQKYDLSQDYDFALRMAERYRCAHLPFFLYKHRVHGDQQSQQHTGRQERLTDEIRADSKRREELRARDSRKMTSIIMLTLERPEITTRAITSILEVVRGDLQLIVFDNGSSEESVRSIERVASDRRVKLIRNERNWGVGGGRARASQYAEGDYLLFLDNDIVVDDPELIVKLIERLEENPGAAACCCKVVFPDGKIQFNGGKVKWSSNEVVSFGLVDNGCAVDDLRTLHELQCEWIPGGATMWRRAAFAAFPPHPGMLGAFEDNEVSFRIRKAGRLLLNCPTAAVWHYHHSYDPSANNAQYLAERYKKERIIASLRALYREHSVIVEDDGLYQMLGLGGLSVEDLKAFLCREEAGEKRQ